MFPLHGVSPMWPGWSVHGQTLVQRYQSSRVMMFYWTCNRVLEAPKSCLTKIVTIYFDTTWYGQVSHLDMSKCRTSGEKVRIRILLGSESLALSVSALNTELALAPDLSGWSAVATVHLWYLQGIMCFLLGAITDVLLSLESRFLVNRSFCHLLYPFAGFKAFF